MYMRCAAEAIERILSSGNNVCALDLRPCSQVRVLWHCIATAYCDVVVDDLIGSVFTVFLRPHWPRFS